MKKENSSQTQATLKNAYEDLSFLDNKADEGFFRYGRFKQAPIIYERTPDEIPSEPVVNKKRLKCVLPKVDFVATDYATLRRLAYCIEDDASGNILFSPEILNIITNERAPSSFSELDSNLDALITSIESCLNEESAVDLLKRALEKLPNDPVINSMALYYGIRDSVVFENYKVECDRSPNPIFLYQSGFAERFTRMVGIQIDIFFDELPLNVPEKIQRNFLVDSWLETEKERSERFFLYHSPKRILFDDPFENDPERAPLCKELEITPQERFELLIVAITGFSMSEIQRFSGLLQLEMTPIEKLLIQAYSQVHLLNAFIDYDEPGGLYYDISCKNYEELTVVRNQAQKAAFESPLNPQCVEKFISLESTFGCTFAIRHWLSESWDKFKHDASFIVFVSQSLKRNFPDFSQTALLEKGLRLHFLDARMWLHYLNVTSDPTSVAYRAINTIPYHKKLYMKAIQRIPDEKDKITLIKLMELKGLRMRTFLEEFDVE